MSRLLRGVIAALTITFLAVLGLQVPAMAAPANDSFANATTLSLPSANSGATTAITGSASGATTESGEATCCWLNQTVWYTFTAQKTANYQLDLCGSDFDTFARVYTGSTVATTTEVTYTSKNYYNNDAPGCGADGKKSKLAWIGFIGTTYKIQVGANQGGGGSLGTVGGTINGSLSLISPANDFFGDATAIPAAGGTISGTNVGASVQSGEGHCCWTDQTVWYAFTPATTTSYTLDLCASSFDTYAQVFTGSTVDAISEVSYTSPSNYYNDAPGCGADGKKSKLSFQGAAGTTYRIRVGTFQGYGGSNNAEGGTIGGSLTPSTPPVPPAATLQAATPKAATRHGKTSIKVAGTIGLPSGVTSAQGCSGTVTVTVKSGPKTLSTKTASVSSSCGYAAKLGFKRRAVKGSKVIVTTHFSGNAAVGAATASKRVKV